MADIGHIISLIFAILSIIGAIIWLNSLEYKVVIEHPSDENFQKALMSSPPMRNAILFADTCNDGLNENCSKELAIQAIEAKV